MIRSILLYLTLTMFLAQSSTPLLVVSNNPRIPRIVGFDDLLNIVNSSQVNYVYLDISASASMTDHRIQIQNFTKENNHNFVKHISVINPLEQQKLEKSMITFDNSNTFTIDNMTSIKDQTAKIIADENILTSDLFKALPESSLIILNFRKKATRLLQQATQTNTSPMLSVMTPSALSGLLVAGFLLVVLLIAINCLMDLKTNDRFPRNILNVGKES